jgi:hypothetical protein
MRIGSKGLPKESIINWTGPVAVQYANSAGQVYYVDLVSNTTSYAIPNAIGDTRGLSDLCLIDQEYI